MKTTLFSLLSYYKALWQNREQNIQYWKEIVAEFIKQKHNSDISKRGFLIKMYSGRLLYKLFFIVLTLQGEIVIELTKKLVASYMVGDLAFLD